MLDSEWFHREMVMRDNLIVRFRLKIVSGGRTNVVASAFICWVEEGRYNCAEVIYRNDHVTEEYQPLELKPFNGNEHEWIAGLVSRSRRWHSAWQQQVPVASIGGHEELAPSHPLVISHLSRFEGMAIETGRKARGADRITYEFVARRLRGIVNAGTNSWQQVLFR